MTSDNDDNELETPDDESIKASFQGETVVEGSPGLLGVMDKLEDCIDEYGEEYGIYDVRIKGVKPE